MSKSEKRLTKEEMAARGAAVGAAVGGIAGAGVGTPATAAIGTAVGGYVGNKMGRRASQQAAGVKPAWSLVLDARLLWERYVDDPTKKNLRKVESHCEKMKSSKSKAVKQERQRCMRAVRAEKKRIGLK